MKKFVSFCVAVAVAASAVPVMAQCASCGGAPAFSQPVASSYIPQASYSVPQTYSSPVYSAPMASAPVYNSSPVYSQPMASAPVYSAPMASSPVYSQPMMSSTPAMGCGCCGGGIVDGGMVSGGIVDGGMVSGGIISDGGMMQDSVPAGGQIISWEGGQQIQGTIVSDVLLEEGSEGSMMSEGAESNVDVVEPPAAATEDSPGPDAEEETEGET